MYLKDLEQVVEKIPEDCLDMKIYGRKTECGTTGCLFGHYAMAYPGRVSFQWVGSDLLPFGFTPDIMRSHFELTAYECEGLFYRDGTKSEKLELIRRLIKERTDADNNPR